MSYLFCISFPRKVFTTRKPHWVGLCVPWPLASGCPCWCLAVCPPANWWPVPGNTEGVASAFIPFLHPVLSLFKPIKSEPSALDECGFSSCSNHKWIVRVIPFLVTLFAVISKCHLWACTDTHSSFLFPVPGSLWCQHDQHSWASQLPGPSMSQVGLGQPTQCREYSHGIPGKPTLWQYPKGPPFLMGFRPLESHPCLCRTCW